MHSAGLMTNKKNGRCLRLHERHQNKKILNKNIGLTDYMNSKENEGQAHYHQARNKAVFFFDIKLSITSTAL